VTVTFSGPVRDVERRIQKAERDVADNPQLDLDRPVGVPASYTDHARLMFDLQILAMQGDVTRVMTFQLARETSNRTYPEIGVPDPHHPLSHHGNDPAKIERMSKINAFHVSLFAEFLQKLAATKEGDGTLLDHSLYLYGSGIGNPNVHDHTNLPVIVAGGASAGLKGNRQSASPEPPRWPISTSRCWIRSACILISLRTAMGRWMNCSSRWGSRTRSCLPGLLQSLHEHRRTTTGSQIHARRHVRR
jgi:hypothetical protein